MGRSPRRRLLQSVNIRRILKRFLAAVGIPLALWLIGCRLHWHLVRQFKLSSRNWEGDYGNFTARSYLIVPHSNLRSLVAFFRRRNCTENRFTGRRLAELRAIGEEISPSRR